MARVDVIVLGAGMVGTSTGAALAKKGVAVALVDRRGVGEETSYGNTGLIEGNTLLPPAFPRGLGALLKVAFKRAPEANYHAGFLRHVAPWLLAYRAASRPAAAEATVRAMRPLFARALAEHETLMARSGSIGYLRKNGWLKLYRSPRSVAAQAADLRLADEFGLPYRMLDAEAARALEPALRPVFAKAIFWESAASLSNPRAVTRIYADYFTKLGGVLLTGDARSLHRVSTRWRVETEQGPVDADDVVVALGPWSGDLVAKHGLSLPLAVKRGYHRHYEAADKAVLTRPLLDADIGYCLTPMEEGLRLTTGAEFADRDALPTPVQIDRVLPAARKLFPLGAAKPGEAWLGARPCFPDSRPAIGRAPGVPGLWLACGHAHWGITLGPVTGRLIAEMYTGTTPFADPAPFAAERFLKAA